MAIPHDLLDRLRGDAVLRRLAVGADAAFALAVRGGDRVAVRISDDRVDSTDDPAFTVTLDAGDWEQLLHPDPAPRRQHLVAFLAPRGTGAVDGDHLAYAQHLHLLRRVVEVARERPAAPRDAAPPRPDLSGVRGRYLRVFVPAWGECDVYVESAGAGSPVLLLHTAGADGRQYHGLLSDPRLTERHELIAFDLPWHGRSNPASGARSYDYALTTASYTDCIAAVVEALRLERPPVIVGASMAGAAVLEMTALHPDLVGGAVSCQAGPRVGNRHTPWLRNPRVNQTLHVPEWTYGLMSPQSPEDERDRVWWGYSQGGWGTYERDIAYYSDCWDIDNVAHLFDERTPPVVLMNGHYDYSVPPEATQELLARVPRAVYRDMPDLGHFPHAENPRAFGTHLLAALDHIEAARAR